MIQIKSGPCKVITLTVASAVASAREDAAAAAAGKWIDRKGFAATVEALEHAGIDYATYVPTQDDIKAAAPATATRRTVHPARIAGAMDAEAGDINNLLRRNGNAAAAE